MARSESDSGEAASGSPWVAGAVVAGRYRLERLLGEGGMGVVWAAKHTVTRRSVALKFLTADAGSDQARRRFLREARAAAAVRHPNVIDVYDFLDLEDGTPVMVMELLSGESLAGRLARVQRLPLGEAAAILLPVVAAVGAAHAMGIIHRDLKPENIFLQDGLSENVKVLDFGIAKLTALEGDLAQSTDLTDRGALIGTPYFLAPEQVLGEGTVDHRVDIWALGLILYQCLSGLLPTRGENLGQVLRIIAVEMIRPIQEFVPDLPADVGELLGRMLSRKVDARVADLREVGEILARYAGVSAPSFGPPGRQVILGDGGADPLAETKDVERAPAEMIAPVPPTPNNLPLRRLFVGREKELAILDETLERKQRVSLFGLAGTGKTALTLEYAHRTVEVRAYPGGVWWILAEGPPLEAMLKLAGALRAGAPALLTHVRQEAPAEEQAEAARIALQNQPLPSLLVLDNVTEPSFVERLPGGTVQVLATLRDRRLALGEAVELEPLEPGDAYALVEAIAGAPAGEAEAEACDRVVREELGGLTVAVEVAARAVKEWAGGWVAYKQFLAKQMAEVLDDARDRSQHYPHGVIAALDLSIDRCASESPAQALLEGAAMFAPDGVPLAWAYAAADLTPDSIDGKRALATLEGLGLIKVDRVAATLSTHRLVQRRVEHKAAIERWFERIAKGTSCLAAWMAAAVGRTRAQMEEVDAQRAHVEAALRATERVVTETTQIALRRMVYIDIEHDWFRIANDLARHLRYRGQYETSRVWSERALTEHLLIEPPNLGLMAASLTNLALALQALGDAQRAFPLLELVLAISEETHLADHPGVAISLSNLARVLPDIGEAAKAQSLLEYAVVITEKTYGADHPDVAASLSNLAGVLVYMSEPDKARPLLDRALDIAERAYGAVHPTVATILSNLAMVLRDLGEADRARALLERSLDIEEKTYGPDHPEVAKRLSKLSAVLRDMGKASKARLLLERALDINETTYGPDHHEVAKSLTRLSAVLRDLGEVDMAHLLFQRVHTNDKKATGSSHLEEKTQASQLTLQESGEKGKAHPGTRIVRRRRLAIAESVYGPDHPVVATILLQMAALHGDPIAGQQQLERALRITENIYGPDHPDVAARLCDIASKRLCGMASVLRALGEADKARPLLERALRITENIYGPDHPDVAARLCDIASVLRELGEADKARPLLERAFAISEKIRDPNGYRVAQILLRLARVFRDLGEQAQSHTLEQRATAIMRANS